MRHFTFVEGNSSKFWEIDRHEDGFTVRYGKLGTAGQTQTKTFDSSAQATKEYDKLVAEKVKKGYVEGGAAAPAAAAPKGAAPARKAVAAAPGNGEARRFEFEEGNSSKFWEISVDGDSFTVTYGKIGTAGQSKTKTFDDENEAEAEAEKLIAEKVKKGYEEV